MALTSETHLTRPCPLSRGRVSLCCLYLSQLEFPGPMIFIHTLLLVLLASHFLLPETSCLQLGSAS